MDKPEHIVMDFWFSLDLVKHTFGVIINAQLLSDLESIPEDWQFVRELFSLEMF